MRSCDTVPVMNLAEVNAPSGLNTKFCIADMNLADCSC